MNIFSKTWNWICEKFNRKDKKSKEELSVYEEIAKDLKHDFAFIPKRDNNTIIFAPENKVITNDVKHRTINLGDRSFCYPETITYNDGSCTKIQITRRTSILMQQQSKPF